MHGPSSLFVHHTISFPFKITIFFISFTLQLLITVPPGAYYYLTQIKLIKQDSRQPKQTPYRLY